MADTDPAMLERYLQGIRSISKPQRFVRALELSALARSLAWQGANRQAGHLGAEAVVERFLLQLYGPDVAQAMAASRGSAAGGE